MRKILTIVTAIIMIIVTTGIVSASGIISITTGGATNGQNGQDVDVTIQATGMDNVGALQLVLAYDKNVINAVDVTNGALASGLFSQFIDTTAGKGNVGWISSPNSIGSGTGNLATIRFHVVGTAGQISPLDIRLVTIEQPDSMQVTTTPNIIGGTFTVTGAPTQLNIIAPADITKVATGQTTFIADLGKPKVTGGVPPYVTSNNAPPGNNFLVGSTIVIWTATDNVGTKATATQKIIVTPMVTGTGKIQGKVFNDLNKNKNLDPRESGIANVGIKLTGTKSTKGISLSTVTDKNGDYQFSGLKPGSYIVQVKSTKGWVSTTKATKTIKNLHNGDIITVNFGKHK